MFSHVASICYQQRILFLYQLMVQPLRVPLKQGRGSYLSLAPCFQPGLRNPRRENTRTFGKRK